jgi:hypothetical protein
LFGRITEGFFKELYLKEVFWFVIGDGSKLQFCILGHVSFILGQA